MSTIQEREALVGQINQIPGFVDSTGWIDSDIRKLGLEEELYPSLKATVDILRRHPDWTFSHYGICQPSDTRLRAYTPLGKIEFLYREIFGRELFFNAIDQGLGSRRFRVRMGETEPFELTISNEIQPGGTRFSLTDGKRYPRGKKVELGIVDLGLQPLGIRVNLLQDHNDDNRDGKVIGPNGKPQRISTIVANKQKGIKRFMRRGRPKLTNFGRIVSESAGVEELVLYLASELMVQVQAVGESDSIFVPDPDNTFWGGNRRIEENWDPGDGGSAYQTVNIIARTLKQAPLSVRRQLSALLRKEGIPLENRSFRGDFRKIATSLFFEACSKAGSNYQYVTIGEKDITLSTYIANMVMDQIPPQIMPPAVGLKRFGYYEGFKGAKELGFKDGSDLYEEFMHYITCKTPEYLRTFAAYYIAFLQESLSVANGRNIPLPAIRQLPFTQDIKIEPIVSDSH